MSSCTAENLVPRTRLAGAGFFSALAFSAHGNERPLRSIEIGCTAHLVRHEAPLWYFGVPQSPICVPLRPTLPPSSLGPRAIFAVSGASPMIFGLRKPSMS